ncbi:type I methionyl aminopeptidase [Streptomonospora litoralis]|uniref:Methionine aminopeptidase n=1 Tax=Streptomonospora litoralis TaxID=2498135 RepID=A0A4P6QA36_9ACTN|nr:type I methionyl aminopeptidase [Streptomonospora litoralis]QBI56561.1 Methionine aminopeptidase 1 [Streptomonospora litoralis]
MVELKSDKDVEAMRKAGRVVAEALAAVQRAAAVGVSLRELDDAARAVLDGAGAGSPFLDYQPAWAPRPFPGVICTSVNDAVVHGIPTDYRLRDGDLVGVDCGAEVDGWTGDAAVTFPVGNVRPADLDLLDAGRRALESGIAAAVEGNRIGDISDAIEKSVRGSGCGIPEGLGGHGIGRSMHEAPDVPNAGRPGRGYRLRPGLVLALEPMLAAGGDDEHVTSGDGWTVHTADGTRAVHFEHTVAITSAGPRILTLP